MAEAFLADALPRRWAHTIGVAATAERLVDALDTVQPEAVVAAAWLHDIGYAPDLADTGFHPIDGAAHVSQAPGLWSTVNLIAHHSGAVFEAQERGMDSELAHYRFPVDVEELAILNAADLCTSPDGALIDPQARLDEILKRYPPDHPVHRAITRAGPLLLAQARLVTGAAEATQRRQRRVGVPERVECVEPGPSWRAVWSGDHRRVVTATRPALPTGGSGVVEIRFGGTPPSEWEPDLVEWLDCDVCAATEAAAGGPLNWHEYRAHEFTPCASRPQGGAEDALTSLDSTFFFDDIARLQLDMAAEGRSVRVQLRTIATLSEVTEWRDIPAVLVGAPIDLRGAAHTVRCAGKPLGDPDQPLIC
jgi:hypothetical protein